MIKARPKLRIIRSMLFNCILFIVMGFICPLVLYASYRYTHHIIDNNTTRENNSMISEMTITIDEHTSLNNLTQQLAENNFISNPLSFYLEAQLAKVTPPFNPGQYVISSNMSHSEILELITTDITNQDNTITFTIPEGYTISQIANKLDAENIIDKDTFLKAVQTKTYDYDFLQAVPDSTNYKLEGYLFPDTYIVRKDATAEEIIIKMLNRFQEITSRYNTYLTHTNYSLHEVLTIASMIESEAKLNEERSTIAGVIYNRLNAHMNLQMCSTIQYLLDKRKANLSFENLKVDSPYNTYLYAGLPPGPICSPGEASFEAALLPEVHDYYYFVLSDENTGSHAFSQTASEHNVAKSHYKQSIDKNFYE